MKKFSTISIAIFFCLPSYAQNVGIGIATPQALLHIKGNADTSQLVIDANATQSNTRPLIRLRKADGTDLLHIHSDNIYNTFIGLNAGRINVVSNFLGIYNTFIGSGTGYSNTSGYFNTASGTNALHYNTIGHDNTANGLAALSNNTTASDNVAIGSRALVSQSFNNGGVIWISNNVAVGNDALYQNNPTSVYNGVNNTAIGTAALNRNTTGTGNTATGMNALYNNQNGFYNTAIGKDALINNTDADYSTAIGYQALFNNNAYYNTANGSFTLYKNTTGIGNTAIGEEALYNNVGGSYNIAVGYNSGTYYTYPNINNSIGIGNNDIQIGTNNQIVMGNFSSTGYLSHNPWGTFSDARIKTNIKEEVKGLEFITRLRPVTYYKSIKAMVAVTGSKETKDFPGKYDVEKIKFSGFLAQEVEKAANESGYDFSGLHKPNNSREMYALSYETFVVPLVKAVQEQQIIIEKQNKLIEDLLKRVTALEKK
ncbi:MAG: tail fiber domain-containing protein [Ferruginibacter sp.]